MSGEGDVEVFAGTEIVWKRPPYLGGLSLLPA
jgi:hypothetical protein